MSDCDNKVLLASNARLSSGKATHVITAGGPELNRQVAGALKTEIDGVTFTQTQKYQVVATEEVTLHRALFDEKNDDAAVLAGITAVACGSAPCSISQTNGAGVRRALQQEGEISVTITYDLEGTVFANLGTAFDAATFASELATELAVNVANITVIGTSSDLSITYLLTYPAPADTPTTESYVDEISTLVTELNNAEVTVLTNLGLQNADISSPQVDLCGDRDCYERGTCDTVTGICSCNSTAYWGINCETLVSCQNGGTNVPVGGKAYCECNYPSSGVVCATSNACVGCT